MAQQQKQSASNETPSNGNNSDKVNKSAMPLTMMGMMAVGLIDQTTNMGREEVKVII